MPKRPPPQNLDLPPYVITYRRVSTAKQLEKDLSLPAQAKEQQEAIEKLGGIVLGDFEDGGISGKTAARDGFQAAMTLARSDIVKSLIADGHRVFFMVWKLNRFFRSRLESAKTRQEFKDLGIRLLSVTQAYVGGETLYDKTMDGIMELLDEIKLDEIREDTRRGLRYIRETQGRRTGRIPYGYGFINKAVPGSGWNVDALAAPFVVRLFEMCAAGSTLAEMTRWMNAAGPETPSQRHGRNAQVAGHWLGTSIREMLLNRVYLGEIKHTDRETGEVTHLPGAHPPLIGKDLFDRAQAALAASTRGRRAMSAGVFSGLLSCPLCGAKLHTHTVKDSYVRRDLREKGITPLRTRYHCGRRRQQERARAYGAYKDKDFPNACPGWQVGEKKLLALMEVWLDLSEQEVRAAGGVKARRKTPGPLWLEQGSKSPAAALDVHRAALAGQSGKLAEMQARLSWQHAQGLLSDDGLTAALSRLKTEQERSERAFKTLAETPAPKVPALTLAHLADLRSVLLSPTLTPQEKRHQLSKKIRAIVPSADKTLLTISLNLG